MIIRPEVYVIIDNDTKQVVYRSKNAEKLSRHLKSKFDADIKGYNIRNSLVHFHKGGHYSFFPLIRNNRTFWKYRIEVEAKSAETP